MTSELPSAIGFPLFDHSSSPFSTYSTKSPLELEIQDMSLMCSWASLCKLQQKSWDLAAASRGRGCCHPQCLAQLLLSRDWKVGGGRLGWALLLRSGVG